MIIFCLMEKNRLAYRLCMQSFWSGYVCMCTHVTVCVCVRVRQIGDLWNRPEISFTYKMRGGPGFLCWWNLHHYVHRDFRPEHDFVKRTVRPFGLEEAGFTSPVKDISAWVIWILHTSDTVCCLFDSCVLTMLTARWDPLENSPHLAPQGEDCQGFLSTGPQPTSSAFWSEAEIWEEQWRDLFSLSLSCTSINSIRHHFHQLLMLKVGEEKSGENKMLPTPLCLSVLKEYLQASPFLGTAGFPPGPTRIPEQRRT